ncbi:MAG: hypothetical protein M1812_005477 [Candelaria pacifica]|nr:MAG: hypothetical protein M1812_005477 [Candelaria pacifica]
MSDSKPYFPPACQAWDGSGNGSYAYPPSLAPGIVFSIIFGFICIAHLWGTIKYRTPWLLFFVIGSGLECLGWIARAIGHICPYSRSMSTLEITVLIMGPAWFQCGIYITLWIYIVILGRRVSPLPPKTYLTLCVCFDTICLSLQATGGGLAGSASTKGADTQPGTTTMVAGIIAQLVLTCLFSVILSIVFSRGAQQIRENRPLLFVAGATCVSTSMIIIRGVYRSIELAQGWRGNLISHEAYVIALDAVPMIICMSVLAVFNPAALFSKQKALMEKNQSRDNSGEAIVANSSPWWKPAGMFAKHGGLVEPKEDPTSA